MPRKDNGVHWQHKGEEGASGGHAVEPGDEQTGGSGGGHQCRPVPGTGHEGGLGEDLGDPRVIGDDGDRVDAAVDRPTRPRVGEVVALDAVDRPAPAQP